MVIKIRPAMQNIHRRPEQEKITIPSESNNSSRQPVNSFPTSPSPKFRSPEPTLTIHPPENQIEVTETHEWDDMEQRPAAISLSDVPAIPLELKSNLSNKQVTFSPVVELRNVSSFEWDGSQESRSPKQAPEPLKPGWYHVLKECLVTFEREEDSEHLFTLATPDAVHICSVEGSRAELNSPCSGWISFDDHTLRALSDDELAMKDMPTPETSPRPTHQVVSSDLSQGRDSWLKAQLSQLENEIYGRPLSFSDASIQNTLRREPSAPENLEKTPIKGVDVRLSGGNEMPELPLNAFNEMEQSGRVRSDTDLTDASAGPLRLDSQQFYATQSSAGLRVEDALTKHNAFPSIGVLDTNLFSDVETDSHAEISSASEEGPVKQAPSAVESGAPAVPPECQPAALDPVPSKPEQNPHKPTPRFFPLQPRMGTTSSLNTIEEDESLFSTVERKSATAATELQPPMGVILEEEESTQRRASATSGVSTVISDLMSEEASPVQKRIIPNIPPRVAEPPKQPPRSSEFQTLIKLLRQLSTTDKRIVRLEMQKKEIISNIINCFDTLNPAPSFEDMTVGELLRSFSTEHKRVPRPSTPIRKRRMDWNPPPQHRSSPHSQTLASEFAQYFLQQASQLTPDFGSPSSQTRLKRLNTPRDSERPPNIRNVPSSRSSSFNLFRHDSISKWPANEISRALVDMQSEVIRLQQRLAFHARQESKDDPPSVVVSAVAGETSSCTEEEQKLPQRSRCLSYDSSLLSFTDSSLPDDIDEGSAPFEVIAPAQFQS